MQSLHMRRAAYSLSHARVTCGRSNRDVPLPEQRRWNAKKILQCARRQLFHLTILSPEWPVPLDFPKAVDRRNCKDDKLTLRCRAAQALGLRP